MGDNVIGAYGPWASRLHTTAVGASSLRARSEPDVEAWRGAARARVWACLGAPDLPPVPRVRVDWRGEYDGLRVERLSWQLPWGPRTEAVLLRPRRLPPGARLPGLLALHDHGGNKYFGWRKIASIDDGLHPLLAAHRAGAYDGLAWANEAARRGHVVLVPDTFTFGSRRVRVADCLPAVAGSGQDPGPDESSDAIQAYNTWAAGHEHVLAKALFSAGTTWPGVFLREDQVALGVLAARRDVDADRLSCGGLSGGGLRTVFLAGLDDRVRSCFCVGFFTTWRDLVLWKNWTHTWMTYVPLLPQDLDFPEILGLRAPASTLVQNCTEDPLFSLAEVKRGGRMVREVFRRAGAPRAFRLSLYPGGHAFSAPMQDEAFEWVARAVR